MVVEIMLAFSPVKGQLQKQGLVNEPIDIITDFYNFKNTYYLADSLAHFNLETARGKICYKRYEYKTRYAFNNMQAVSVIPNIKLAQSTKDINWSNIELKVYSISGNKAAGEICSPSDPKLQSITVSKTNNQWQVDKNGENTRLEISKQ